MTNAADSPAPPLFYSEKTGNAWALLQDRTDAYLDPLGRAAMARLSLGRGARVIDVGCGCGQTLLELAELVGPTGRVLGLDISPPMLTRARERTAAHPEIELALADAQTFAFTAASFDALFSRFGVMFFGDPRAAFSNLGGALRPGGELAFVCWQEMAKNPWATIPLGAVQRRLPEAPVPSMLAPGQPGPFAFADADALATLLRAAGFTAVDITPFTAVVHIGAALTVDEAVEYYRQIGPAARFIADAPAEKHDELLVAMREAIAPLVTSRGLWMEAATFLVHARKSG